jgi:recombination protein RecR
MKEKNEILPNSLNQLIHNLNLLPGIGSKTAQRLGLSMIKRKKNYLDNLISSLSEVSEKLKNCQSCQNICENEFCSICLDEKRSNSQICVIEDTLDLIAIENSGYFKGKYFVIQRLISPLNGIMPSDTMVDMLIKKLNQIEDETELILGLNSTADGEATSMYIVESISNPLISITKLASGLPFGSDLDYADSKTLSQALENRKSF